MNSSANTPYKWTTIKKEHWVSLKSQPRLYISIHTLTTILPFNTEFHATLSFHPPQIESLNGHAMRR